MVTKIKLKNGSRYAGEIVVEDIANGVKYLGDLIFYQGLGHDLTGWTLGGTTVPTISADGQINLYEATNSNDQPSWAYITLPNSIGQLNAILCCKFTRQADDTSLDNFALILQLGPITGGVFQRGAALRVNGGTGQSFISWTNNAGFGSDNSLGAFIPTVGVEYQMALIITSSNIIMIIERVSDGVIVACGTVALGYRGTAALSSTPINSYRTVNKIIGLWARHDAGQVSHYHIREVAVARLVGVSQ